MIQKIYYPALLLLLTWDASANHHLRAVPDRCFLPPELQPLDQVLPCYLTLPEKSFKQELLEQSETADKKVTIYSFRMTSLRWEVAVQDGVDHPEWQHRVEIYIPEEMKHSTALLYINGGTLYPSPKPPEPDRKELDFARIARTTQSIVINLKDVPNQHLTFKNTTSKALKEDALIAYTWGKFLENPEKNRLWPLRLPMVKSAVAAMNMAQDFARKLKYDISDFVVSGGSKRGWTAWLVAALDNRVAAVAPMVIDVLNLQKSMDHHKKAYGDWARAVGNYRHLMPVLHSEGMDQLLKIVEPYSYRKDLNIPKYIINASSDDFFLPDSSRFYYQDLPGEKWIRVLPNATHYIVRKDSETATATLESFYGAIVNKRILPTLKWSVADNKLKVIASRQPEKIVLWKNHNSETRDFRLNTDDNPYASPYIDKEIHADCERFCTSEITMEKPESGWNAYFVEARFNNAPFPDFVITTRVFIYPDSYPAP